MRRLIWYCALAGTFGLARGGYGDSPKPTVAELRAAATKGDAKAETELAYRLWRGDGVTTDKAEAIKLFRQAAWKGHAQAQFAYGYRLQWGLGVEKNLKEASNWFIRASNQGHAL